MTSLVGIYCTDGIVIGADGVTTIANQIEQPTEKVVVFDRHPVIFAGAGNVGYIKRLNSLFSKMWNGGDVKNVSDQLSLAKLLTKSAIGELEDTYVTPLRKDTSLFSDVTAMVGFAHGRNHGLCILEHGSLQPVLLDPQFWYISLGNNSHITNTFLALIRDVFWRNGPPDVAEGKFAAIWTLQHVIQTNVGGVGGEMSIATIDRNSRGQYAPKLLTDGEIALHRQAVDDAKSHLRDFMQQRKQLLLGEEVPEIPKPTS